MDEVPGVVFDKVPSKAHEAKSRDAIVLYLEAPDTPIFNDSRTEQEIIKWISPLSIVIAMQLLTAHW